VGGDLSSRRGFFREGGWPREFVLSNHEPRPFAEEEGGENVGRLIGGIVPVERGGFRGPKARTSGVADGVVWSRKGTAVEVALREGVEEGPHRLEPVVDLERQPSRDG
jgi:hypothetical protein